MATHVSIAVPNPAFGSEVGASVTPAAQDPTNGSTFFVGGTWTVVPGQGAVILEASGDNVNWDRIAFVVVNNSPPVNIDVGLNFIRLRIVGWVSGTPEAYFAYALPLMPTKLTANVAVAPSGQAGAPTSLVNYPWNKLVVIDGGNVANSSALLRIEGRLGGGAGWVGLGMIGGGFGTDARPLLINTWLDDIRAYTVSGDVTGLVLTVTGEVDGAGGGGDVDRVCLSEDDARQSDLGRGSEVIVYEWSVGAGQFVAGQALVPTAAAVVATDDAGFPGTFKIYAGATAAGDTAGSTQISLMTTVQTVESESLFTPTNPFIPTNPAGTFLVQVTAQADAAHLARIRGITISLET